MQTSRSGRGAALAALLLTTGFSAQALAGATVVSAQGDVRATGATLAAGQRIEAPTLLETGAGARVVLSFDDGAQVVLHERTQFRLVDSYFSKDTPKADRAIFDLLSGAARFTTGEIAARSRVAWRLHAPQATVEMRGSGADFMASVVNPLYLSVLHGALAVNNAYGTVPFGAGSTVAVAHSGALAVPVSAGALPAQATTAFAGMSAVPAGPIAAGAPASGAAATEGIGFGGAAAAAAAVAAGIAAAAGGGKGTSSPQHSSAPSH
jgi:hypothetical protein